MPKRNADKLARAKVRPDRAQWDEDEVMTLVEAATVFFPQGPLKAALERSTKKRRPPAKIASRLRPHLVHWRKIDGNRTEKLRAAGLMKDGEQIRFVVNRTHDGQPLAGKIRSAWEGILEDAGLGDDVVRHSLRHTAATWLMQAGVDMWEAAGWLGMTVEQLEANYGHHHPDFQEEAAEAFGGRR